jgi:hypothetical protein
VAEESVELLFDLLLKSLSELADTDESLRTEPDDCDEEEFELELELESSESFGSGAT